jgi:hypothetical protein
VSITWLLGLLPDSPFVSPNSPPSSINLGYVTWLIDFPLMLRHLSLLLVAISAYYLIRVVARWIKVSRG